MNSQLICKVPDSNHNYEIKILSNNLDKTTFLYKELSDLSLLSSKLAIITDDQVAALHTKKMTLDLCQLGLKADLFSFPQGEKHKTRATKEFLENQLFEKSFSKDTCIIAIGGGVVLDISGYLASTFCRGVPLVMMPTSLLGMVDASIGGKNGINVPYGKNLIGSIYPPKKVIIDQDFLRTLDNKEFNNGIVEIVKHGLIADNELFEYLENNFSEIQSLNPVMINKIILDSCQIKKDIVEEDEKENGKRRLLNFGHTVGHALEQITDYTLSHGQAVALGIIAESYLSVQMNHLSKKSFNRINHILHRYLPNLNNEKLKILNQSLEEKILNAMSFDKKALNNKPRFVILNEIGKAKDFDLQFCTSVEEYQIKDALNFILKSEI